MTMHEAFYSRQTIVDFAVLDDRGEKLKESKGKRDKYLDLARELKKTIEQETDGDINCN